MGTWWNPKPLRPQSTNPLFEIVDTEVVVKGLSPIRRQRLEDGTPHTITGPTALEPADPTLYIAKGSLVEKYDNRPSSPKMDPIDPIAVVKAYMAADHAAPKETMSKSNEAMNKMTSAINSFAEKAGFTTESAIVKK